MKYRRQRELQEKIALIPRGPRGSAQNQFRNAVWFLASQLRYTFEEALDRALRLVRQREPSFVPTILPGV